MGHYVAIKDFEDASGRIDWAAYRKAQVENGESCSRCGAHILFGAGHPTRCGSCRSLDDSDREVTHDHFVRCPHCRYQHNMGDYDCDFRGKYVEGEHEMNCDSCGKKFTFETHVSFSYTSPEMAQEPE